MSKPSKYSNSAKPGPMSVVLVKLKDSLLALLVRIRKFGRSKLNHWPGRATSPALLSMQKLTPEQIKEAFPEGKEILQENIKIVNKELKVFENYLKELYGDKIASEDLKIFMTSYVEIFHQDALYKRLTMLTRQLRAYDNKDKQKIDVPSAKTIPIEELYEFKKTREGRKRISCFCPYHDEKIPSFVIYKDSNSFHCFSCKASGDSISFIMKLNRCTFIESVKYLNALRS